LISNFRRVLKVICFLLGNLYWTKWSIHPNSNRRAR